MSPKNCPKCGHVRRPDAAGPFEHCAACGLYFDKWAQRAGDVPRSRQTRLSEPGWQTELRSRLTQVPEGLTKTYLYGRTALLLLFFLWGIQLALMDYRDGAMAGSFMHAILLPIHESLLQNSFWQKIA